MYKQSVCFSDKGSVDMGMRGADCMESECIMYGIEVRVGVFRIP